MFFRRPTAVTAAIPAVESPHFVPPAVATSLVRVIEADVVRPSFTIDARDTLELTFIDGNGFIRAWSLA